MPIFPGWKAELGQHLEKTVRKRKEKQEQRRVPEIARDNPKMHGWASGDCPRAGGSSATLQEQWPPQWWEQDPRGLGGNREELAAARMHPLASRNSR